MDLNNPAFPICWCLIEVGTKVFLKSLQNHNGDAVLATVVSCNPKFKLDGAELTNK